MCYSETRKAKDPRLKTKYKAPSTKLKRYAETNDGTSILYFLILLYNRGL
jgi:hypothetical protein